MMGVVELDRLIGSVCKDKDAKEVECLDLFVTLARAFTYPEA